MKKLIIIILFLPFGCRAQQISCDSLNKILLSVNDTLRNRLRVANAKILLAQRHLRVVDKNPKNVKYIKGWLRRDFE